MGLGSTVAVGVMVGVALAGTVAVALGSCAASALCVWEMAVAMLDEDGEHATTKNDRARSDTPTIVLFN